MSTYRCIGSTTEKSTLLKSRVINKKITERIIRNPYFKLFLIRYNMIGKKMMKLVMK